MPAATVVFVVGKFDCIRSIQSLHPSFFLANISLIRAQILSPHCWHLQIPLKLWATSSRVVKGLELQPHIHLRLGYSFSSKGTKRHILTLLRNFLSQLFIHYSIPRKNVLQIIYFKTKLNEVAKPPPPSPNNEVIVSPVISHCNRPGCSGVSCHRDLITFTKTE